MEYSTSNSPIEARFWQFWLQLETPYTLTPQHPIGNYRVDFACLEGKIAIELDGHATHSSPDAIAYDRKRQREIEFAGWRVIRFGGKEIITNAYQCVLEVYALITLQIHQAKTPTVLRNVPLLPEWDEVEVLDEKNKKVLAPLPDWDDVPMPDAPNDPTVSSEWYTTARVLFGIVENDGSTSSSL
jgi:very-short-patch-repair endonuclease